jgi:Protein of unknown function (DUF2971)
MSVENFYRSLTESYLHLTRVDSYTDFSGADIYDGDQLPSDKDANGSARFQKQPSFTCADYYATSRSRTYACCFSLDNSDFIWKNYGNGGTKGKICIVFEFGKLRTLLNRTMEQSLENQSLMYGGLRFYNIFSINYGMCKYVDWNAHKRDSSYLANPIEYVYLKDGKYAEEREFRITLSALGLGHFVLNDGTRMQFPAELTLGFDFKIAIMNGVILNLLHSPDCEMTIVSEALRSSGIHLSCEP